MPLFSLSTPLHGQDLSDPDEDVKRVGVDAQRGVDRIELSGAVDRMPFCSVDDLLGVVQHEAAEENEASVEGEGVDAGAHGGCLE